jgi:predicted AAA+ superfamily ATPase
LGDKEVDFVAKKGTEIKYIQVCYLLSSQMVIDREFGNLLEIQDNYEKIVLSLDDVIEGDYKGIKHYNLIEWLAQ